MKTKYIMGYKNYTYVDCENDDQIEFIKQLNKDMESFIKSQKRYNARTISMDHIINNDGCDESYELPDDKSNDIIANLIEKEKLSAIYEALDHITSRQKEIFLMSTVDNLTYKEIGKRLGINEAVAFRHYQKALAKIKEYVKNKNL